MAYKEMQILYMHVVPLRGGPVFRMGFSILSVKGFLVPHPPFPKSFQRADKNLSIDNPFGQVFLSHPPTHLDPFAKRIEKPVWKIGPPLIWLLTYGCTLDSPEHQHIVIPISS